MAYRLDHVHHVRASLDDAFRSHVDPIPESPTTAQTILDALKEPNLTSRDIQERIFSCGSFLRDHTDAGQHAEHILDVAEEWLNWVADLPDRKWVNVCDAWDAFVQDKGFVIPTTRVMLCHHVFIRLRSVFPCRKCHNTLLAFSDVTIRLQASSASSRQRTPTR